MFDKGDIITVTKVVEGGSVCIRGGWLSSLETVDRLLRELISQPNTTKSAWNVTKRDNKECTTYVDITTFGFVCTQCGGYL